MKAVKLLGLAVLLALAGVNITACGGGDGDSTTLSRSESVFAVSGQPRLIVDTFNGRIEITGSDAGEVRVEAEFRNPERVNYQAAQEGNTVRVTAEKGDDDSFWGWLPWRGDDAGANIRVIAPREAVLEGRSSNGSIRVANIAGSGSLHTSNSGIMASSMDGIFSLSTSNGEITLREADGDFRLKSSNGNITVASARGEFDLDTSNGSIRFEGDLTLGSDNRFESSNGNITAALTGEPPNVRVQASTSNGDIVLNRPVTVVGNTDGDRISGVIGEGSASLTMDTSNGTIRIE